ncbi:MAG TPA: Asp-tRNA(Asn)/Glu-tRNA(Gln) amidotransferase subunit GatA [Candidatus Goldiibacteriota bacterium]|nr:Asp-tRNA(Asn)/Glu-tRNA(Gln) amidotransferase subunit GatA [Candidatus Goldiibacteriota bacterium]
MELYAETIESLHDRLIKKEIKASDILDSFYKRVDAVEPKVMAHLHIMRELAYSMAAAAQERIDKNDNVTMLTGIPLGIKDNMVLEGQPTTCAARMLEGYRPPYTATVLKKLEAAGAVFTGKLNMDEYAFGSSTENSGFHVTHNPWDLERVPGGSSGGSAAAVAAQMCAASLGSDTGGSIKQPAALCGVTGLKPTYGRVSRYGLIAFGSSLDQIGPITSTAADNAILLSAIAGADKKDSTSAPIPVPDYYASLKKEIKGLRIGLPEEYFIEGLDAEVKARVMEAVAQLEKLGARAEKVSLAHTGYAIDVYYVIATAEASSNLARFDGVQYGLRDREAQNMIDMYKKSRQKGFGKETKRRIMLGTYVLSSGYYDAYYKKAQKVRTLIKRDFDEAFKKVDIIATPTSPTTAFKIGEKTSDSLTMYLSDIFTIGPNMAGLPGISIPCGFDGKNLPVGLQLIGKPFGEQDILDAACVYQSATEWHKKKPKI